MITKHTYVDDCAKVNKDCANTNQGLFDIMKTCKGITAQNKEE